MNTRHYLKNLGFTFMLLVGSIIFSSCDDCFIYDDEGDCSFKVRFVYDYNMKNADAFSSEVEWITLYLLDESGNIVWQKTESGSSLATQTVNPDGSTTGYLMTVDVKPGSYRLLCWAGTRDNNSFTIGSGTYYTNLTSTLERSYDANGAYVNTDVDRWFYGYLDTQVFTYDDAPKVYTMNLIKDTNIFRVVLQHVSGDDVEATKFTFQIDDDNGFLDWDNNVVPTENITYYAWHVTQGSAEVFTDSTIDSAPGMSSATRATFAAAIAELTTSRLVTSNSPRLTVTNNETGKVVFSIPLKDYALLLKSAAAEYSKYGDQEFLDRQDEWDMVFFLDEGDRWMDSYIYINSWKIVLQSASL